MQLKDQWKKGKDWKVVTAVAAVSALGISGFALAEPGGTSEPDSIELVDQQSVDSVDTNSVPTTVQEALNRVMESVASGEQSTDSPLDQVVSVQSAQSAPSAQSAQSPANSPADSPLQSPADSPAASPVDSPADSPTDSPAGSPVDSPADSPADSGSADS